MTNTSQLLKPFEQTVLKVLTLIMVELLRITIASYEVLKYLISCYFSQYIPKAFEVINKDQGVLTP